MPAKCSRKPANRSRGLDHGCKGRALGEEDQVSWELRGPVKTSGRLAKGSEGKARETKRPVWGSGRPVKAFWRASQGAW